MKENEFNIESIDVLKKMQREKYKGWTKYLIPFCSKYFDAKLSLKFTQKELSELYEMKVSIDTLRILRNKYKEENLNTSQKRLPISPITISPSDEKKEVNTMSPNNGKLSQQEREEKNKLLEKAIKNMADFDNRPAGERTELDDLIDKHQQLKSKG